MNCSLCGSTNIDDALACSSCGASLSRAADVAATDALPPGTMLQYETYRIDAVLGQGGFGITYRGFDLSLQRPVAIKEFFPFGCKRFPVFTVQPSQAISSVDFSSFKQQFVEEARVLARFKHPSIVDVYSVWEENNAAYMVMELLEGQTLEDVLHERNQPLDEPEVLGLAQRVGAALSEVHRRGLLHRDIKPANIVRCDDGRVMLIDFGTAREYSFEYSNGTQTPQDRSVVVTPGYAPLEQYAENATRGAYTDIYSLSATLYHLLTGEMPPAASDRALGVELRPAHELNPQVSPTVSAALGCAMETQVARRPQSVDEFLQMLHGHTLLLMSSLLKNELSSTQLPNAQGYTPKFPQKETKTINENLSFDKQYERASIEAREKLESLSRVGVVKKYERPSLTTRKNPTASTNVGGDKEYERPSVVARQQLLNSLPPSPPAPNIGTSPQDALMALIATRGTAVSSLQSTSSGAQPLLPSSQASQGSIQVRSSKVPPPLRIVLSIFGVMFGVAFLSIVGKMERHAADPGQLIPITPAYNSQPTTDVNDFLQSQNLEVQQPFASRQLPVVQYIEQGSCQFSADGKKLIVTDGLNQKSHIYEVPSLRPICVLPKIAGSAMRKFSADGSLLLEQTVNGAQLWDAKTGKRKFFWREEPGKTHYSGTFDISPNGKFVIGMPTSSTIEIWSTESGKTLFTTRAQTSFSRLMFTLDSKQWISFFPAAAGQSQMQRYEVRTGKTIAIQNLPNSADMLAAQLLPGNRFATSTSNPSPTGGVMRTAIIDFQSSDTAVQEMADITPSSLASNAWRSWPLVWSSGPRFILGICSCSSPGAQDAWVAFVRRFDPKTMKPLGIAVLSTRDDNPLPGVSPLQLLPLSGYTFSPDNKFLYVINGDGKLLTWRLDQLKWQ